MTGHVPAVLFAGSNTPLSAPLEASVLRAGMTVHWIDDVETVDGESPPLSNVSKAVLQATPPPGSGRELREFRHLVFAQLHGLVAVMPERSKILLVVDTRHLSEEHRPGTNRIGAIMTRIRAAAAQERGKSVMVNAVFVTGAVDDGTLACRIRDAMFGGKFPDTGFIVFDHDIRRQSIAAAISEQCS